MKYPVLALLIIMFLTSCDSQEGLVTYTLDESANNPVIQLTDESLGAPFRIVNNAMANEGSFYFESEEGINWVKGAPENMANDADAFKATWNIDNREVTLEISRGEGQYNFSFSAAPDDDILGWGFNVAATEGEYFTGLFERVVDGPQTNSWEKGIEAAMNLRGQSVDMLIKATLSLYNPFYLSSNGYGLFIEGTWPGHYDMCKENPELVQISFDGPSLSGILYTSDKPSEIVKKHSLHIGPTIVPPRWAFLPYRWRDNNANNETYYDDTPVDAPFNSMLVEDILMMEAYDIPCGVYWLDRPWAEGNVGYNDFKWDLERYPNPDDMIAWLNEKDIKLLLWIAPWVDGEMAETAREKGYNLPTKPNEWSERNEFALIDFTNDEAKEWWQQEGLAKVLKQGIKGFKLDRSEELVPESRDITFSNGKTAREMRNKYPVLYAKATNEICRDIHGDDFVIFPRAGYTGSPQYAVFWGGDIGSPPEGLRAAIVAAQRAAVIGYPLWGSDIGGYWHGPMYRDVTARWLAFGAFNPIMEFGPTRNLGPWGMATEPHYDTALIATWRLYAKIHTMLADYSLQLAEEAHETGMPPIRPLFMEYGEQADAWNEWQTFTYGPDILVTGLWEQGQTTQEVYLPSGKRWIDAWDKSKVYEGGQRIAVEVPFHKIPIFIREGSEIDLGDLNALYEESLQLAEKRPDLSELQKTIAY